MTLSAYRFLVLLAALASSGLASPGVLDPALAAPLAQPESNQIPGLSATPQLTGTVPAPASQSLPAATYSVASTNALASEAAITNLLPVPALSEAGLQERYRTRLELARHYRHVRQPHDAEPLLIELLGEGSPEAIKQQALLELAMAATEQDELPRALQIYAQYLARWPNALLVPEILLRQGQLFRQMGLNNLAMAKFYGVMTSALVLKNDRLDYYQRLVLAAQSEIAETHFQVGKYEDASEFFSRLLKQNSPALDRPWALFRLVRSVSALGRNDETVAQAQDYLAHYSGRPEQAEVRFHLALALKQLGRNAEARLQVLTLLQEQKVLTKEHPELWAYWQQRAGNEIGNQLYREGDYARALEIYLNLAQLDSKLGWQLPVLYQIGLTYERLEQPEKALTFYRDILKREPELGDQASPGMKALFEMAKWRTEFLGWQTTALLKRHVPARDQSRAAAQAQNSRLGNP